MIPSMSRVIHILDARAPRESLEQLELLASPKEAVISIGPPPAWAGLTRRLRSIPAVLGWTYPAIRRLERIAIESDILHAWTIRSARIACGVTERLNRQCILSLPCLPPAGDLQGLLPLCRGRTLLLVHTEACRRRLASCGIAPESVLVVPPAAPAEIVGGQWQAQRLERRQEVRRRLSIGQDDPVLAAPSEMAGWAQKYAIWTYAILKQIVPAVKLLLPGTGAALPHVRHFNEATGYESGVQLTGDSLSRADCLAAADIALFLGERDLGLSSLAATMAAGLPIVASATPDMAEILIDEENSLLVPPRRPKLFAADALRLLDDPAMAHRLGEAAADRARRDFAPEACRQRLAAIYFSEPAASLH